MKRIVEGKVYDTATAESVASDSFSYQSDFHYWSETLYKTKKGAYFLHGEGGPMSQYSQDLGNNSTGGGSALRVMTDEEAYEWLARVDADKAIELFPGEVVEA